MSDPFLSAHQVYPHFFNLGGQVSPISIRDQMLREQDDRGRGHSRPSSSEVKNIAPY